MRLAAFLLLASAACTDPVVEMQLVLPKTELNPSCLSAVEVHANGTTFPSVKEDRVKSCIEVSAGSTYASVRDAIRGKFTLTLPDSGLSSLEIFGWSGPAPCTDDMDPYTTPDLLFYGNADYIGQDQIQLPMIPNLDCGRSPVKVRLVDMFALLGGATCTVASTVPDGTAGAGLGTLLPRSYGKGVEFYGNIEGANMTASVAAFDGYTKTGTKSCLAVDGGGDTGGSTGCVISGTSVCAQPGEIEQVSLSNAILANSANFDTALAAKYPGIIIGSVWNNGTTKTPVTGATVEIDPAHGQVVYLDPPAAGQTQLKVRTDAATGASGLFMIYTDTLIKATVKGAGTSRTVQLGAADDRVAGAMIVMN